MDEETRLVIRIMHLAYLVQRLTNYCVFIVFSGHIDQLELEICQSKENWQTKILTSEMAVVYKTFRDKGAPPLIAELKAREKVLEAILIEQRIPFDDLNYEDVYSRIYTF